MPKNKVLTSQSRRVVYDVNGFIKNETNDIVDSLKLIKTTSVSASLDLQKEMTTCIQSLERAIKRSVNLVDKSILTEIYEELENIQNKSAAASKTSENKLLQLINYLKNCQKRTAMATNTSVPTIRRILLEADNSEVVFKTPGKKRPRAKPVVQVDNADLGVIKRCIHTFHQTYKEILTVAKLRKILQEKINFQGSSTSLREIIKNLGFRYKKIEKFNRKVLVETSKIRLQRIEYLQKIQMYRQKGRAIIFTGASYVDSNPKGQGVVIVHAGFDEGFVPDALLTINTDSKTGDCHDNLNSENYKTWLETRLIPNIPPNSVVVVDPTLDYNKHLNLGPTSNSKKEDMQAWLSKNGIDYNKDLLKPQLYELIKGNISVEKIVAEHNHTILRLPRYHPDLNPIEIVWPAVKLYVESKSMKWNIDNAIYFIKKKINGIGAQEWEVSTNKVKVIEEEYAKCDHVIDTLTEKFTIDGDDDDSSESDVSQAEDEDSGTSDEDMED